MNKSGSSGMELIAAEHCEAERDGALAHSTVIPPFRAVAFDNDDEVPLSRSDNASLRDDDDDDDGSACCETVEMTSVKD